MSFTPHTRLINPRLGTYFGIFVSAVTGLFMLALIFEELGMAPAALAALMLVGPLLLYMVIGAASATRQPIEYFAAGRRVPAVYVGLGLALTALGASGLVSLAGLLFIIGFDALWIMTGTLSGFIVMAVLLAPFLRKFGAFTIPTYLGRRFDSRMVRLTAAGALAVPMLLVLAAELRLGAVAASLLSGLPAWTMILALAASAVAIMAPGGTRGLTWVTVAQMLVVFASILVPTAIVGVYITNFPLAQLSAGPIARTLTRLEFDLGLPIVVSPPWGFEIPNDALQTLVKRFGSPFGLVGPWAFTAATLTTMAGIASAPWLLPRVATAPGVYEARKSLGWATFFFGVVFLTLSAAAIFLRYYIMDATEAHPDGPVPVWLREMAALGFATFDQTGRLSLTTIGMSRDSVLYSLPLAAGLPLVVMDLAMAGAIAAALGAAGAAIVTLGHSVTEDIVGGLSWEAAPDGMRLWLGRLGMVAVAACGSALAILAPTDPMRLVLWALALSGSAAFPVLVMSIWWKRINAFGALAGIVVGFAVATLAIVLGEARLIGLDGALAGVFGIPAGTLAAGLVSAVTAVPGRTLLEILHDFRVPGGEIASDREARLARNRKRQRV